MFENKVIVYGFRHETTGKTYIGYQPPGKSFYISSSENADFWRDYSQGMLRRNILFIGDGYSKDDLKIAQALEWFGLDYAISVLGKDMMYNAQNNAHSKHEDMLTVEHKQVLVDWIEGRSDGIVLENTYSEDNERVAEIVRRVEEKEYAIEHVSMNTIATFSANQVRVEQYIRSHVNELAQRMSENPEDIEKKLTPIVAVVGSNGPTILDGNNRRRALEKVRGVTEAPVIFINETEFGDTEESRKRNYNLFGLMMNKEDDVVRETNSNSDIKRQIQIMIDDENLDLTKHLHVDRARKMVEDLLLHTVIPTKKKLAGIWKSFMTDFEKGQAEQYRQNMKVYDDGWLRAYTWNNYESKDVAAIHASMSKTEYAQAFAYICRRMKNVGVHKGAIVLHYATPYEFQKFNDEDWLNDLRETVNHSGLDITVDVLPAFEK